MMFCGCLFYNYFCYSYKGLAGDAGLPEDLITLAGTFASVSQCLARVLCGYLYDKFGFKTIFNSLMIIAAVNSIGYYYALNVGWLYFICVLACYMVVGGVFALFPAPV